jgi:hypothetical protein
MNFLADAPRRGGRLGRARDERHAICRFATLRHAITSTNDTARSAFQGSTRAALNKGHFYVALNKCSRKPLDTLGL